jgi:lipopolysaccharide/colanic/teichoic acid biosynthesis glycosyltransferase
VRHLVTGLPPGNLAVVTSRDVGVDADAGAGADATVWPGRALQLRDLDSPQVSAFVRQWVRRRGGTVGDPEPLLDLLRSTPARMRMASDPLLLTLLCRAYDGGHPPPEDVTELLQMSCMSASPSELRECRRLREHRLAVRLVRDRNLTRHLQSVSDARWRNVFVDYAAMADATAIVHAALAAPPTSALLNLAVDCATASRRNRAELVAAVKDRLDYWASHGDPRTRTAAEHARLRAGLGVDQPVAIGRFLTEPVTAAHYHAVVPGGSERSASRRSSDCAGTPPTDGQVVGLSHRESREFCELLNQLAPGPYSYRLPTCEELASIADPRTSARDTRRFWCSTAGYVPLTSAGTPYLRALTQRSRFQPFPPVPPTEAWDRRAEALLREDLTECPTGTAPSMRPFVTVLDGRPAQHGCDPDEVARLLTTTAEAATAAVGALGELPLLRVLLTTTRRVEQSLDPAGVVIAPGHEAGRRRRAARMLCLAAVGECRRAAGRPSSGDGAPAGRQVPVAALEAFDHAFTELLAELVGCELVLQGRTAELPRLRCIRSAAPTALDLDSVVTLATVERHRGWWHCAKPVVDRSAALTLLLLLGPVLLAAVLWIRGTTRGPAFFVQSRVGKGGRLFRIYKLRTMVGDASASVHGNVLFKSATDPRITRTGRLLRKTSLDELPQLFNVVQGQMSLVGPRPFLPEETELMDQAALRRLTVRPGLTGLWQVSGRADLGWDESIALDAFYVQHCSAALDLRILMTTPRAVLSGRGAY